METIANPNTLDREKITYQNEWEERIPCYSCKYPARLILLVDDEDGELASNPPARKDGIPIHPHDSCVFALYMCTKCGVVTTLWNQA